MNRSRVPAVIAATLTNPKPAAAHPAVVAVQAGAAYVYIIKESMSFGEWLGGKFYDWTHAPPA